MRIWDMYVTSERGLLHETMFNMQKYSLITNNDKMI